MVPKNFLDLLAKFADGTASPNVIDMIMLKELTEPTHEVTALSEPPEIGEIVELTHQAFSNDTTSKQTAQAILFAFRQMVASEEVGDRQEAIRQSEAVLMCIDSARFPAIAAASHLKIGTALLSDSNSRDELEPNTMIRAVDHLESALRLSPQHLTSRRAMAAYNAALALHTLWQSSDDWDDDADFRGRALRHGLAAIDAMNNGEEDVGSRDSISRVVLSLFSADEPPLWDDEAREQITNVLRSWLDSPEGRELPTNERSSVERAYDELVRQQR